MLVLPERYIISVLADILPQRRRLICWNGVPAALRHWLLLVLRLCQWKVQDSFIIV